MIAFGCSITSPEIFEQFAERGIHLAAGPDARIFARATPGSIFRNYNAILDEAAGHHDLDALVLVHQDAEIVDPDFCLKVRRALRDPQVGVVGCVGAIGVRSIAWWEGSVTWASFSHRYGKLAGEEFPSLSWNGSELPPYARTGEVDTVDGFVLALAPWTVQNVRFDESLGQMLHGYDFDFCLQVRAAGRRVVTQDLRVVHHHSLELADDLENWVDAHMAVAEKWDGRMPGVGVAGGNWKQRARRAEAEAAAARAQALSTELRIEARVRDHQRQVKELTESTSWRLTAPLRRLRALRTASLRLPGRRRAPSR